MSESRTFWLWQDITGRRGGRVISIPFYTTSFFLFLFPIFYFVFFFFLVVVVLPGLCHNSSRAPASSPLSFLYQTRANIKKKEKEKRIRRERERTEKKRKPKKIYFNSSQDIQIFVQTARLVATVQLRLASSSH